MVGPTVAITANFEPASSAFSIIASFGPIIGIGNSFAQASITPRKSEQVNTMPSAPREIE
ncbi:MAG: hypothetical protein LXA50_17695 [Betaproteobacteria bacterium]|jgi:hypothetical protein|nr:hypothetical protein [Betaproteobacteria bacterium]